MVCIGHKAYINTSYEISSQWWTRNVLWYWWVCSLVNCSVVFTHSVHCHRRPTLRRRMVIPVTWGWLHCFVRDRESCLLTWGGPSWHLGNTCTSPPCTAEKVLTHQTPGWRGKPETFRGSHVNMRVERPQLHNTGIKLALYHTVLSRYPLAAQA